MSGVDVLDSAGRTCNHRARTHTLAAARRAMRARGIDDYVLFDNPYGRGVVVYWWSAPSRVRYRGDPTGAFACIRCGARFTVTETAWEDDGRCPACESDDVESDGERRAERPAVQP